MVNVLELFSTDRRLLETRGSLIIRQLCLHLNAERIFRTIAEILEKDDVSLPCSETGWEIVTRLTSRI
jgi:vacuole morphology and inheritance protein 14